MNILVSSFFWQLTPISLHKKLSDFCILPSLRKLHRLSRGISVVVKDLDLQYLKQRISNLTTKERIVALMMDAQRVEYCNGSFIGVTEDSLPAKTVLTFMVQSTCSTYIDVVCLVPINKLDTASLRFWFDKVMMVLSNIFFIAPISTDHHTCNK